MPLAMIRDRTETALEAAGFKPASYAWIAKPNRLVLAIGSQVKIIALHGRMSAAKLERVLGRIEAYGEMQVAA